MTRTSIHEYVAAQRLRYLQASRPVKRRMLDEVVTVTGYHRKAAVRRLRHPPRTPPRAARTGRPRVCQRSPNNPHLWSLKVPHPS